MEEGERPLVAGAEEPVGRWALAVQELVVWKVGGVVGENVDEDDRMEEHTWVAFLACHTEGRHTEEDSRDWDRLDRMASSLRLASSALIDDGFGFDLDGRQGQVHDLGDFVHGLDQSTDCDHVDHQEGAGHQTGPVHHQERKDYVRSRMDLVSRRGLGHHWEEGW